MTAAAKMALAVVLLLSLTAAVVVLWSSLASPTAVLDDSTTLTMDYLIQNVCVDTEGRRSDPYQCTGTSRDLRVGETLPYHKHDRDASTASTGAIYQLSDAFPLLHSDGTTRVVHTLDFVDHGAAALSVDFVQFDPDYDGFNANQASTDFASIVGTADPSGGVQYFISNLSDGHGLSCSVHDAWGLWRKDELFGPQAAGHGSTLFWLNIVRDKAPHSQGFSCPASYNPAFTTYELVPNFRFASGKVMDTVVQQHWAGLSKAGTTSGEKEFFTKEYGMTRWEAWTVGGTPDTFCGPPQNDTGGWVLVGCRDWSFTAPDPDGGYVPQRFPVDLALIAGGNMLDNGDFGRGMADVGKWQRSNTTRWSISSEASHNTFLAMNCTSANGASFDSHAALFQVVDVPAWLLEGSLKGSLSLGFVAQLWAHSEPSPGPEVAEIVLTQLDGAGAALDSAHIHVEVPSAQKRQFSSETKLLAGCAQVRFEVRLQSSSGTLSVDNSWVAAMPAAAQQAPAPQAAGSEDTLVV